MSALSLFLALTINTAPTAEARHLDAVEGTWDAQFSTSAVHINVRVDRERGFTNYGRTYELDELTVLRRGRRAVGFELRRSAGNFRFVGVNANTRASGGFEFVPSTSFKKSAQRLGLSGINRHHQLTFALNDLTLDDVKFLQRTVQGKLTTAQLVHLLNRGVTPHYVRDLSSIGFARLTPELLVRTRDHGVNADYVRGMRAAGLRLTLDEYINARDRGVSLDYIADLKEVGLTQLTLDELVALRQAGVQADFVRSLVQAGETVCVESLLKHRNQRDY